MQIFSKDKFCICFRVPGQLKFSYTKNRTSFTIVEEVFLLKIYFGDSCTIIYQ